MKILKVINVGKVALAAALCAMLPQAQAQHNATLYFMRDLPLSNMLNPAFQPEAGSLYIGYPVFSSIYIDAGVTARGASVNNLMSAQPNLRKVAENVSTFEGGNARVEVSLFNLGVRVRDMYFTLDVTAKAHAEASVPGSLVKLAWYGNAPYVGRAVSLEGLGGQAQAFTEFALGFSKEVLRDKATVGGKVKYLMGHAFGEGYLGGNSFVYTDPDTWSITAGVAPEGYTALPSIVNKGCSIIAGNGGSVDLGFEIKGERFAISGSLINLGFISWKNAEYEKAQSVRTFAGVTADNGNMVDMLQDSLFDIAMQHGSLDKPLRRWIDPTLSFSTSYRLHQNFSAGALVGININRYNNYPLLALALNTHELPINGAVSYSYSSGHNLGLGVLFGRRETQLHLICDNVLAASYRTTRHVNLRMGLNLLLGAPKNTDPHKKTWQPLSPTKAELKEEQRAARKAAKRSRSQKPLEPLNSIPATPATAPVNKSPLNATPQQNSTAPANKAPLNPIQQEAPKPKAKDKKPLN